MMISRARLAILQDAFAGAYSSRVAAEAAGVAVDTARRWRRFLEANSVIQPCPSRINRNGRLVRVENLGAHMAPAAVHGERDVRRIQYLKVAA